MPARQAIAVFKIQRRPEANARDTGQEPTPETQGKNLRLRHRARTYARDTMERADEQCLLQEAAAYMALPERLPASVACRVSEHDRSPFSLDDDMRLPAQDHELRDDAMGSALYSSSERSQQPPDRPRKSTNRRPKRSRNPSREKLQSELKQLRALSVELEERLVTLQRREKKHDLKPEERSLLACWRLIVTRQLEERTRAEIENAQLKRKLQQQLAIAVDLQRAARQLSDSIGGGCGVTTKIFVGLFQLSPQIPRRTYIEPENVAIFETLFEEVDTALSRMDDVFEENGLSAWRGAMNASSQVPLLAPMKTRRSNALDGSLSVELLDTDVHLFDKESVFRALWQCWEKQYMAKNCVVYESVLQVQDVIAGRMNVDVSVDGESVPVDIKFALKLVVESDRIRYVWRTTSEASSLSPGLTLNETGWEELHSVQTQDQSGNSMEGTVILTCSQMQSKPPSRTLRDDEKSEEEVDPVDLVTQLANMMISSYEAELVEVTCLMMDLLLEKTGGAMSSSVM